MDIEYEFNNNNNNVHLYSAFFLKKKIQNVLKKLKKKLTTGSKRFTLHSNKYYKDDDKFSSISI